MRSRAKRGQASRFRDVGGEVSGCWPLPGSQRGNRRRVASEEAFLEAAEQASLTNWQTHQWERACNRARAGGRRLPDRHSFSKLQRRPAA